MSRKREMQVGTIMQVLMDKDVLEFMCAPYNLRETFREFKKTLPTNKLALLEKINAQVINHFVGYRQDERNFFFQAIPNIYQELRLQARRIANLKNHRVEELKSKTGKKTYITRKQIDEALKSILIAMSNILDYKPLSKYQVEYISQPLVSMVVELQNFLLKNLKLADILESHISSLTYFSEAFSINNNEDQFDWSLCEDYSDDDEVPALHILSISSNSSSMFGQTSSTSTLSTQFNGEGYTLAFT